MKKIFENELQNLNFINSGSFGNVYKCNFDDKDFAFKKFKDLSYLKGKIRKLNFLSQINDNDLILPNYFIIDDKNNIIGYLTKYFYSHDISDETLNKTLEEKIIILKNLKESILKMKKENIIHTDLIPGNILLSNDACKIIDFDNCSFNGSKININQVNDFTYDFIKYYGLSNNVDTFLFNLITFSVINEIEFYLVREKVYLKEFKYFTDNKDAIKICDSFFLNSKYANEDFLIDTIDNSKII